MNEELMRKVHNDYSSFLNKLLYGNRYFCDDTFLDKIATLSKINTTCIPKDGELYRARVMVNEDIKHSVSHDGLQQLLENGQLSENSPLGEPRKLLSKSGIWGYNEKNSGLPPIDKIADGRANPKYIAYLYTAKEKYTALIESKPYMDEKVSIATYEIQRDLNIFDISEGRTCFEDATYDDILNNFLKLQFSNPLRDGSKGYISTQYISEYIKTLGFDGICFASSLHRGGKNITLYNTKKVKFTKSEVYKVDNIIFKTKPVAPTRNDSIDID